MKKIILLLAIVLYSQLLVNAQGKFSYELSFNPHASHRFNRKAAGGAGTNYYPIFRADFGASVNYELSKRLEIGAGLFNTVKGIRYKWETLDQYTYDEWVFIELTSEYINNYIEIPLFLKLNSRDSNKKGYFKFGISYLRLFSLKTRTVDGPDPLFGISLLLFMQQMDSYNTGIVLQNFQVNTIGILLAYGKTYTINDNIKFGGEILFKPIVLPMLATNSSGNIYPYSLGINLYLNLNLKKS